MRAYLDAVGMRLAGGYDVCDLCAMEMPEMLLGSIWASRDATERAVANGAAAKVRDAVPAAHQATFDELLGEARHINRLRDERGIYNDSWSSGIARQALLEAGRRLADSGHLDDAALSIDATHAELLAALRAPGTTSSATWRERADWRHNAPMSEVPPFLGPAPTPPLRTGWRPP